LLGLFLVERKKKPKTGTIRSACAVIPTLLNLISPFLEAISSFGNFISFESDHSAPQRSDQGINQITAKFLFKKADE